MEDSPLRRFVESGGLSVPLAVQIVNVLAGSGASRSEMRTALEIVTALLPRLQAPYFREEERPPEDVGAAG